MLHADGTGREFGRTLDKEFSIDPDEEDDSHDPEVGISLSCSCSGNVRLTTRLANIEAAVAAANGYLSRQSRRQCQKQWS